MATGEVKRLLFSEGINVTQPAISAVSRSITATWDGSETTQTYTVTTIATDSRFATWVFKDSSFKQIEGAEIDCPSSTEVRVTFGIPVAAGIYYLVGVY